MKMWQDMTLTEREDLSDLVEDEIAARQDRSAKGHDVWDVFDEVMKETAKTARIPHGMLEGKLCALNPILEEVRRKRSLLHGVDKIGRRTK